MSRSKNRFAYVTMHDQLCHGQNRRRGWNRSEDLGSSCIDSRDGIVEVKSDRQYSRGISMENRSQLRGQGKEGQTSASEQGG